MKKNLTFTLLLISLMTSAQPKVSFTFDDGVTSDMPGYTFEQWNKMLLDNLDKAGVKAVFFVTGFNKTDEKGRFLLKSWDEQGHLIGNHTFDHPSYSRSSVSFEEFSNQVLRTDSIISQYDHYTKMFRFPYLKEGNTQEKVDKFREFLKENDYRIGHVTIDASDWYIASRLVKRMKEDPDADLSVFRDFYLQHIFDRATFYENLAYELTGRHIKHTLLLHHNLTSALFVDDLAAMFRDKGWEVISAQEAYQDPIFGEVTEYAGESLTWALAKDAGKYDDILRYPAEGSEYEKAAMDELGL